MNSLWLERVSVPNGDERRWHCMVAELQDAVQERNQANQASCLMAPSPTFGYSSASPVTLSWSRFVRHLGGLFTGWGWAPGVHPTPFLPVSLGVISPIKLP